MVRGIVQWNEGLPWLPVVTAVMVLRNGGSNGGTGQSLVKSWECNVTWGVGSGCELKQTEKMR